MANQLNQNDPYRPNPNDDIRRQPRLESELQADPALTERPASGMRVAMIALAVAVVLGAVFYGLNNTSVNQAGTTPASQTVQQTPPAAPPGMRDVTPRTNAQPGMTTGAAPSTSSPSPSTTTPPAGTAPAAR
ncbi:hypothetical protein [Bradyrhizobium sp.]|uniref:hypothetical protein n=1 Tax=Bradyrhizobium sp. TaxID=376 RepID=UPI0025BC8CF3|nr:hypothetical protein [Bradyrhizobium sp.]